MPNRAIAAIVILVFTVACASPPRSPSLPVPVVEPGGDPWEVVMGLRDGRLVRVGLTPGSPARAAHGEQLSALFVGADRASLELRTRPDNTADGRVGASVALSREEVRYLQVPASQDRRRRGGWLGFGIGFGAVALAVPKERESFWPITIALFGAGVGLIGFLIGRGIDRKRTRGDFITVYGSEPPRGRSVAAGRSAGPAHNRSKEAWRQQGGWL